MWQVCPLCKGDEHRAVKCPICDGALIISEITGKPPLKDLKHPAQHYRPAHEFDKKGTGEPFVFPTQVLS